MFPVAANASAKPSKNAGRLILACDAYSLYSLNAIARARLHSSVGTIE